MHRATATPIHGDRWEVITELVGAGPGSVLDIGCRDRELQRHLPPGTPYTGLDLFPPADVIASADEPLPFDDDSFDVVVLADVLEHLEHPHGALDEAMRVATRSVVLLLPNLYHLTSRLRYLAGRTADKYDFGPEHSLDRHRWVLNYSQAASFTRGRADAAGWRVAREHGFSFPFNRLAVRAAQAAAQATGDANLWAWAYAARLEPVPPAPTSSASSRENTASSA